MKRVRVELATVVEVYLNRDVVQKVFGAPIALEVPIEDVEDDEDARYKLRRVLQKLVDEA
jgi:hypothetical protein